jgi:uncharacterized protein YkwD
VTKPLALIALTVAVLCVAGGGNAFAHHYDHLLAPGSRCANQTSPRASVATQEAAMRCMHNYARGRRGLRSLQTHASLVSSGGSKAADIMRCQQFSHNACGREAFYWVRRVGYTRGCWGAGENIAWGSGGLGSVRSIMSAWLHSTDHRNNLLRSRYRDQGAGLVKGHFGGYDGAQVWVMHFGYHC